jgi:hypothetical protein
MKAQLRNIILITLSAFLFSSCEKEIKLNLPEQERKLVVEGWIEQGQPAIVVLTKSSSYFDPIDSAALFGSMVTDATVTVSDGVTTETLALTTIDYFPPLAYKGSTIIGEIGKTYTLDIDWNGGHYSSVTTIKKTAKWDSLWFDLKPDDDSLGNVYGMATDDGTVYNYYRAYTKILHVDLNFVPIYGSVWDDKFFSGQTLTGQMYHGIASNIIAPDDNNKRGLYYKIGDTVLTRLSTMDSISYSFWKAAESEIFSGGNPFSSTTSVPTNIVGGALGCWTGYGSTYDTIICKK